MQNQLRECVERLNRLYKLYQVSRKISRPHRISVIRNLYELQLNELSNHTMIPLDANSYHYAFGHVNELEVIVSKKEIAIADNNFEEAAVFRDYEKKIVGDLLVKNGLRSDDKYLFIKGKIYFNFT